MDNSNEMEARLWEYIDGLTPGAERSAIEQLIAENGEWKAKYRELLEIHQSIQLVDLEQPSMRFTRNVMEEISRHAIAPATKNYINKRIVWSIALFFIAMIAGCLIYGMGQINWGAATDTKNTLGVDLGKIDYSSLFNNNFVNVFMMLNIVLGLFLLDHYLGKKKKQTAKEA